MIKKDLYDIHMDKKGFAAVFSKPILGGNQCFFRINSMTAVVSSNTTNHLLFTDSLSLDNRLYNRMKFLSETNITVINILNRVDSEKGSRFLKIPVKYKRDVYWQQSLDPSNDYKEDEVFKVTIFNLTKEEFFDMESILCMVKEEPNKTIFFFEEQSWSEIVHNFYMCGVSISGGSTNQRHLFNSLSCSFTMLLTTLFGKKFTQ